MTKKEFKRAYKTLSKYAVEKGLTKNYAEVATDYRKHVKYIFRTDLEENVVGAHPSDPPKCCMCKKGPVESVFYPCQHACVCNKCIERHKIGTLARVKETQKHKKEHYFPGESLMEKSTWSACPLCISEIKRVVRLTNNAEQDYEDWVYDVKPPMPWFDTRRFATVGKMLKHGDNALVIRDQHINGSVGSANLPIGESTPFEFTGDTVYSSSLRRGLDEQPYNHLERHSGCCVIS